MEFNNENVISTVQFCGMQL